LQQQIASREDELRFLTGETTGAIKTGQTLWQEQLPDLGPGLPSALLTRRPDIRESEQNLVAANANIGIAESAYFPNITLTAGGGQESTAFRNLLSENAATYFLQPQVNLPIFTAGRIKADVQRAKAQQQASLAAYRGTVLAAFRDVADVLARRTEAQTAEAQQQLMAQQQADTAKLADRLKRAGVSSSLEAFQAQEAELLARYDLAAFREQQLVSVVQLYRALGGGWTP
jgi:multidrug efflux system outer membrane protein